MKEKGLTNLLKVAKIAEIANEGKEVYKNSENNKLFNKK